MFNKDLDVVPEEEDLIILDGKSDVCMYNNCKDIKCTRHISRRIHKNEKCTRLTGLKEVCCRELFKSQNEIYCVKSWQVIENTCTRGVTGYMIVCRNNSSIWLYYIELRVLLDLFEMFVSSLVHDITLKTVLLYEKQY